MAIPTYEIFIDWDNDGGFDLGNFEVAGEVEGWEPSTAGPPAITTSPTQSHIGDRSLRITWTGAASQFVSKTMTGLVPGRSYTFSAWVFVGSGDQAVRLDMAGTNGTASTTTNAWEKISVAHTATSSEHTIQIEPSATPTNGDLVYFDQVMVVGSGEDVTARVLARDGIELSYGRDTARSLAEFQPGETTLLLDNNSRDYSPDNTGSPLYGYVVPGRNLLVRATFAGKSHTLFNGYVDDYTILPGRTERSIQITALDVLQKLNEATISTALYRSLQTGEAIHKVLDAVGWPASKRVIDPGATTIPWWWEEGTDAFEALTRIVSSEGPPAIAFTNASGNFVFKGRHHRLLDAASTGVQASFVGGDGPISFVAAGTAFSDTAAGTSYTLNRPAGTQVEDLMIAFVFSDQVATNTEPAGWTEKRTITVDDGTDDLFLSILVKDAAVDDPSSWAGSISVSSSRRYARVLSYRGTAPAAQQFIDEDQATSTGTSATLTTATATGGQPGNWRVAAFLVHDDSTAGTGWGTYTPTQTTERFDVELGTSDPVLSFSVADSGGTVSVIDNKVMSAALAGAGTVDSSASWIGIIRPYEGEGTRFEEDAFEYDIGWKDIVNSVEIPIEQREPTFTSVVFESEDVIVIPGNSTKEVIMEAEEIFYNAITPVEDTDYVVSEGSVTVSLSRDSGETATIFLQAGANTTVVHGLKVRAVPVPIAREIVVKLEDASSITNHGVHSLEETDLPWVNVNDAEAVAQTILGLRAERLPLVTFKITNSNDNKTTQILSRDLSDRIHVVEDETFTDHDFFVERIDQGIEDAGSNHHATFGCERAPTQTAEPVANVFTVGVAGKGFDQGTLGQGGIDSDNVMILGQGLLGTNVLGT